MQTLPLWPNFLVHAFQTAFDCYSMEQCSVRVMYFRWYLPQDLDRNKYLWGQYSLLNHFMSWFLQDIFNLGVLWLPSWTKLWKMNNQIPHKIKARHDQFPGLQPEILILHEMVSDQDRSLHMIRVPTWVVQLYCLEILYQRHKYAYPCVAIFRRNIYCCAWKILQRSSPIIIHLEYIQLLCKCLQCIGP